AGIRSVDRILHENDGIVVREGDAGTPELPGSLRKRHWARAIGKRVHLTRLAHVPVLTELASEIAPGGAEREHGGAGQKMIERLLFDRIDAEPARTSVRVELDLSAFDAAHEAQSALSLVHLARSRTDIALNATVRKKMPVLGGMRHDLQPGDKPVA